MAVAMSKQLFSLAEAADLEYVGGKSYALSKMARAGFNVPDGFVVTASAFMSMTPALQNLVLGRFDELGAQFVAVRSSAINEDGKDAAWAGQLDTFLNCTRGNLLHSIKRCWESAESARAQSYAKQKMVDSTKVAVLVQEMIQSEASGVVFSVHPVTNDKTQIVIEAGLGLGEAIVSGQITPDTYIVDKQTGRCLQKHVAQQTKQLVTSTAGETIWEDVAARGSSQKLSNEQIAALCKLAAELEAFFAYPVDVEWAISSDSLYVLQCRAVTTLDK